MKISLIASECAPFAKIGGLADVVGALPRELKASGSDICVILPFYEALKLFGQQPEIVQENMSVRFAGREERFNLWKIFLPRSRVPLYLIEQKKYFSGTRICIEADSSSGGTQEEAARFMFLSVAGIETARFLGANIIHCHDWHTAIIPFLIKKMPADKQLKTLLTIHNLDYQGIYSKDTLNKLLDMDFQTDVNCLGLGILNADFISTVSPSYAEEILTPEYGADLKDYLSKRRKFFIGILNGLDTEEYDPRRDRYIKYRYSAENLAPKKLNKEYLQNVCFGQKNAEKPLLGMVSRLTAQKGINLLIDIFPELMKKNIQLVLLGVGGLEFKAFFREAAKKYPQKFWFYFAFDEQLARQIYAGADIFLMPSKYEPCGLGQQIAMRYGAVPVARSTGGLRDTVVPVEEIGGETDGTGFLFQAYESPKFMNALETALEAFDIDKQFWQKIQRNGMTKDFSWKRSAEKYKALYRKINEDYIQI